MRHHHGHERRKPIAFKAPGADYEIRVVGDRATPLRDFYHALLHAALVGDDRGDLGGFLVDNALFAVALPGGGRRQPRDAGVVPRRVLLQRADDGDHRLRRDVPGVDGGERAGRRRVDRQLLLTALATGLVFAKFSRSTAQFVFSRSAVDRADERRARR